MGMRVNAELPLPADLKNEYPLSDKIKAIKAKRDEEIRDIVDFVYYIPKTNPVYTPSLSVLPLQVFAYCVAKEKGCDIDKPRNLAKSVTVE